jgi:hypothetical protein
MNSTNSKESKTLPEGEREDLRTMYSEGRADLRSFRDTFYQITGIISTAAAGLTFAGIEYEKPVLLLVVPPLLLVVLVSSVGYLSWRADLIHACAEIERKLNIPEGCAYIFSVAEKLGKSGLPPFFKKRHMVICLALSILIVLIAESLLLRVLFP